MQKQFIFAVLASLLSFLVRPYFEIAFLDHLHNLITHFKMINHLEKTKCFKNTLFTITLLIRNKMLKLIKLQPKDCNLIFWTTLLQATCFIDRAATHLSQISPTEIKPFTPRAPSALSSTQITCSRMLAPTMAIVPTNSRRCWLPRPSRFPAKQSAVSVYPIVVYKSNYPRCTSLPSRGIVGRLLFQIRL